MNAHSVPAAEAAYVPPAQLQIGVMAGGKSPVNLDLDRVLAGRLLVQGSSGAGKSQTLRRIVEEAFEYVTVMIVDPEGEFGNLAEHIGATTLKACELAADGLTAAAARGRHNRLPLHLDLTDLAPDERITKASAFFAGLMACPREDWANTVLVAIDEAHLLAPHLAASSRDAETRRLGVATLTDLCARGRKRGIASIVATQRLAKLAGSVVSELHNALIGLNVFDRDVARAADFLGFGAEDAQALRRLSPGQFYAFGPALCSEPVLIKVSETVTRHTGASPEILGPAYATQAEASVLLDLDALREVGGGHRAPAVAMRGKMALDSFLMDPAAAPAVRIIESLKAISPNATTADDLTRHLGLSADQVDAGLDLLGALGAVDTMPRGATRIARLAPRLRLRSADVPVVGLA